MAAVRADGADAKRTEPIRPFNTGLNAAGSPAGSDQTFVRNPHALVSALLVSEAAYSIRSSSLRACRTSSRIFARSPIAREYSGHA